MDRVCIVEVGPRDGFQSVEPFIPTETKIEMIEDLFGCGFSRMEVGSFVRPTRLSQMRDAADIVSVVGNRPRRAAAVLVPNLKGAELAFAAGASDLVTVISASESHNRANTERSIEASLHELGQVLQLAPRDSFIRFNIATSFYCPFEGVVKSESVIAIARQAFRVRADIEIGLCDTIGKATPIDVSKLFERCHREFPDSNWAFHGHDTYGFGLANVLAAYDAGVRVFDGAVAGLGGCPFAPGATGNVATEDVVYTFERLGIPTGIDLEGLLDVADCMTRLPGAITGGHIRKVMRKSSASVCDGDRPPD